jgi:hypothetical protein
MIKRIMQMGQDASRYLGRGALLQMVGADPVQKAAGGSTAYNLYLPFMQPFGFTSTGRIMDGAESIPGGINAVTGWNKTMQQTMFAGSLLATGGSVISGYSEEGLWGAAKAAAWDVSVGAALYRFGYKASAAGKLKGPGLAGYAAIGGGAAVGTSVGQAVLGPPGGFIGGYVGGGLGSWALKHPKMALGGTIMGVGMLMAGSEVFRNVYSIAKNLDRPARGRGVDTSGDMSSFMTRGANTMRQRAVQAIHKSHLNARSALGQEATFMHMPQKNYHSRYKRHY